MFPIVEVFDVFAFIFCTLLNPQTSADSPISSESSLKLNLRLKNWHTRSRIIIIIIFKVFCLSSP